MRKLLAISLGLLSIYAVADQPEPLVAYACDRKNDSLVILNSLDSRVDDPASRYAGGGDLKRVDPWSLVKIQDDENGTRVVGTKAIEWECALSKATYQVHITPQVFNGNVLGRCGAAMSVNVRVLRDAKDIVPVTALWRDCHENTYISQIRIVEKERQGIIEVTTSEPFYHPYRSKNQ